MAGESLDNRGKDGYNITVKMAKRELATPEPPGNEPGRFIPVKGSNEM